MSILVTGGAGYIGSHTCVELLQNGYDVVVADNYSNSKPESLRRVKKITGKKLIAYACDLLDKAALGKIFKENKIDAVIHFAGLKAVGESVAIPLTYYRNNIEGTLNLLDAMKEAGVNKIVFSSSATVYGGDNKVPYTEDMPVGNCTNPYGWTKYFIEEILKSCTVAMPELRATILRYFNPIGAHESGLIGEDPNGKPNNLMPYITQVAVGKREKLLVYGDDYPTKDGTGVRDYIHVCDLAMGHLKAIAALENPAAEHYAVYNLGTGRGYSVLDVVREFEKANSVKVPYEIVKRRPGDIAKCYASVEKAKKELGFEARFDLDKMCADSYKWQTQNPEGM